MAADGNEFDEAVYYYNSLVRHLGWMDCVRVLCGGVMDVGDIEGREDLYEARALGASM